MTGAPHRKPRRSRARDAASLVHVSGEQQQLTLPGMLWPAGCDRGQGDPLFFEKISKEQANELIAAFGHPLGKYNRSFGYQAWGLAIDGQAVAVAVSGSTVGATSAGYSRFQVVELARIARHPDHPGVMRVMLRLWRDYLAGRWDYWAAPVQAAVSYGLPSDENGKGTGNLYRFDGWKLWGKCKPWAGGGDQSWSNPSKANDMGDGIKSLWYYEYPSAARDISALLSAARFGRGVKPGKRTRGTSGFMVTSPAPGAVRVQYYSPSRASTVRRDEMTAAYARAITAAGYAVAEDCGDGDLVIPRQRRTQRPGKPRRPNTEGIRS
jgi:hypothetical protein